VEVVNGLGEGGELAVWKLSGDADCRLVLEAPEVETQRDVIIRREKEGIRKREKEL
jgi:hypothetical protein